MSDLLENGLTAFAIAFGTGLLVFVLMRPLIGWLQRRAIMDIPNERSSHAEITPRGGGIAVTGGILFGNAVWLALYPDAAYPLVLLGMTVLAVVSWLDDRRGGLPVGLRFGVQVLAVGVILMLMPDFASVTQGLVPLWLERAVLFLAWLWFINLFNFMDGINGISGVEMVSVGAGATLVGLWQSHSLVDEVPALVVAGAALGFLPWNWGRAKVFLGDVGSVPISL